MVLLTSQTQLASRSGIIRKWNTRDDRNARCIRKQLRGARSNRRMVVLPLVTKDGGNVIAAATHLLPRRSWRVKPPADPAVVVVAHLSPQVSIMFHACCRIVQSPFIYGIHRLPHILFIHYYTEVWEWKPELHVQPNWGSITAAWLWMSSCLSGESHTYHGPVCCYLMVEGRLGLWLCNTEVFVIDWIRLRSKTRPVINAYINFTNTSRFWWTWQNSDGE